MKEEFSLDVDENTINELKKAIGYDEIEARHKRFMEGKETTDDLINHIYHYEIKNDKGLDLDVVELKYYNKIIDLYNKEKERNKDLEQIEQEHKKENGRLREELEKIEYIKRNFDYCLERKTKELEEENKIQRGQLNSAFNNGFIHKNKIKEIIDSYNNTLQCTRKYNEELANILCDLEELLEESEK